MAKQRQLKVYTDKHIPRAVAVQLRERGIDVVRCEEIGLGDAKDEEHLTYAAREGRILITRDADFTRLDAEWRVQGKAHQGIFYCLPHLQGKSAIGKIVSVCLEYNDLIMGGAASIDEDIANQIIYVT